MDDLEEKFNEELEEEDDDRKELPKLKYFRLQNDVSEILQKHASSCLALHPKFICIGTVWGSIHLLDHQGNKVRNARSLKAHSVAVNCLDIDARGDYVASCSDDGIVRVCGFYKDDSDYDIQTGRLVKAVAIDPNYGKTGTGKRFITGEERLILHEKTFLSWKSSVLGEAEGSVQSISWQGQFVAWATDLGLRVYDVLNRSSLGFMKWPVQQDWQPKNFRCNLAWTGNTLIIGWVDIVRVCSIRKRGPGDEYGPHMPEYMVDIQCNFTAEYFISGLAPLETLDGKGLQLVLLGYSKVLDKDENPKLPGLQIVQPTTNGYIEIALPDELLMREYKQCSVNQYHMKRVLGENRYFIVSPRDIVVASVYDANDQVHWLLQHKMYEEALELVDHADGYSRQNVGALYIDHLIDEREFEKAGEQCSVIFGRDKKLWEEKIYTLAKLQQLKCISAYLPIEDFRLDKQVYEMVLYEYLKTDTSGFLDLVKNWPPILYHVATVINAVIDHIIATGPDNLVLLEALAILYSHDGKYDRSLAMYLKLKHKDIFSIIEKHKLYSSVLDLVNELMQLDANQAVALFLRNRTHFPVETVVKKLEKGRFLYLYLEALDDKDTNSARPYHGQLVQLHADFGRDRLLGFLRRSDHYSIQEALKICQERSFYREMVHLLRVMGRSSQALELMIDQLVDIAQAIEFCKEQGDHELWERLIEKSLPKPEFISYLLNNIGASVDPIMLVAKIAPGSSIPGLKSSLAKMMKDYGLQVSVQDGCKRILAADNIHLQTRLFDMQSRGYRVDDEQNCGNCGKPIFQRNATGPNSMVVLFFCKHVYHGGCKPAADRCIVCHD